MAYEESDTYGFMATLDGDQLQIAVSTGGGTSVTVESREQAVDAITAFIRETAREIAGEIADELDFVLEGDED